MHDTRDSDAHPVSKTRRKRRMESLQKLGESLLGLDDDSLEQLGLPEELLSALQLARRISAHGARRRQLQYIGKLMREVDTAPVEAAIQSRSHQDATHTRAFHLLEELRETLIIGGDAGLATVLEHFPRADRGHLRKLARQARAERDAKQPPRAARLLFRYLRELQEQAAAPE
jgi:ribosome-associated protein